MRPADLRKLRDYIQFEDIDKIIMESEDERAYRQARKRKAMREYLLHMIDMELGGKKT